MQACGFPKTKTSSGDEVFVYYFLVWNLDHSNGGGLRAFGTLLDGELDLLAFVQVAETIAFDRGEVDEDIRAAFAFDETVALDRKSVV